MRVFSCRRFLVLVIAARNPRTRTYLSSKTGLK
jgi:hypothetical protein